MNPETLQWRRRRRIRKTVIRNCTHLFFTVILASNFIVVFSSTATPYQTLRQYFSPGESSSEQGILRKSRKNPRRPTLVSGFGSSSRPLPQSAENGNRTLWIRDDGDALRVHSSRENITMKVTSLSKIEEVEHDSLERVMKLSKTERWLGIEGFYGVYQLPTGELWVWIVESESVYNIKDSEIRRIKEVYIHHVAAGTTASRTQRQETTRQIQLLRQSLKEHEWYCTNGNGIFSDMTHNLQSSFLNKGDSPWWSPDCAPDDRFFWNQDMLKHFVERKEESLVHLLLNFSIPLVSAFCGVQKNLSLGNLTYDQVLISRRSRFRAGTRFTRRGADQYGHVANYAETEQMLIIKDDTASVQSICSHVQSRGSIPLRWSSPTDIKYRPRVRIGMDPMAQAKSVKLHLLDQVNRFVVKPKNLEADSHPTNGRSAGVIFVNLVDKKSDQGRLGRAMDSVLKAVLEVCEQNSDSDLSLLDSHSIQHIWYDFHAKVKGGRWNHLKELLTQVMPTLKEHGYCRLDWKSGRFQYTRSQTGVVRTNCMDCLDRTNVVQSMFGRFLLFHALQQTTKGSISAAIIALYGNDPLSLPWSENEAAHRLLWADNADAISRLYAGTPALKGDFTRTGTRTKRGALDDGMNSLQRYYLNNFIDADRQEGVDLLNGHQDFVVVESENLDGLHDYDPGSSLSLTEALRRRLLGERWTDLVDPGEVERHATSKQSETNTMPSVLPLLELVWLPGDLREQMRSLGEAGIDPSYRNSLLDIDRRAAVDLPWWVVPDNDDSIPTSPGGENGSSKSGNLPGYVLGTFVAGTKTPVAMAIFGLAFVAVFGCDHIY